MMQACIIAGTKENADHWKISRDGDGDAYKAALRQRSLESKMLQSQVQRGQKKEISTVGLGQDSGRWDGDTEPSANEAQNLKGRSPQTSRVINGDGSLERTEEPESRSRDAGG
ncbi:hypothetical protein EVG20_g11591 [Dentipellis fragilis]|uniref:Uncharacterized protein n=1 Tax=Dentipellis fragilis TaxID=205917 RepID=A0A4Y9XJN1_9AGAM|nr:hypothetical protein EVG20_g11591 [Dentipellis fragilis]